MAALDVLCKVLTVGTHQGIGLPASEQTWQGADFKQKLSRSGSPLARGPSIHSKSLDRSSWFALTIRSSQNSWAQWKWMWVQPNNSQEQAGQTEFKWCFTNKHQFHPNLINLRYTGTVDLWQYSAGCHWPRHCNSRRTWPVRHCWTPHHVRCKGWFRDCSLVLVVDS